MSIGLRTLVLNANYMPVSLFPLQTIAAEEGICRIITGSCRSVFDYDRPILTQREGMNWPSVIARLDKKQVGERVKLTDDGIYYRDHGVCQYCERPLQIHEMTCDHVIPKSHGGRFVWDNIVSACSKCNLMKADSRPVGKWAPKRMPIKPTYYQLLSIRKNFPIVIDDENWMQFLGNWNADVIIRGAPARV